ncbi:hypothetical protein Ddc_07978 [Ditylenchus destructor]|nr:hypothetical protein Ddc_07978 [Ditylenchus destructor]
MRAEANFEAICDGWRVSAAGKAGCPSPCCLATAAGTALRPPCPWKGLLEDLAPATELAYSKRKRSFPFAAM